MTRRDSSSSALPVAITALALLLVVVGTSLVQGQGQSGGSGASIVSGTTNRLAKITGTKTLGNSLFSDDGTNVTLTSGKLIMPNASNNTATITGSNTAYGFGADSTNAFALIQNSVAKELFQSTIHYYASDVKQCFGNNANVYSGTGDACIVRLGAGQLQATDASGNGNVYWTQSVGGTNTSGPIATTLCKSAASTATTGTSKETLLQCVLPANAFNTTARWIELVAFGVTAANGNTKTFGVDFGATNCATHTGAFNATAWRAHLVITRVGSNSQICNSQQQVGTGASLVQTQASPAETDSGNININVFATTPTAAADFTLKGVFVRFLN